MEVNESIAILVITISIVAVLLMITLIVSVLRDQNKALLRGSLDDLNLAAFTDSLQVGQYLGRKSQGNPFVEYTTKIKIYDIKDGWVKYKYVYDDFSDELNDKVEFSYSKISDLYRVDYKQLNN